MGLIKNILAGGFLGYAQQHQLAKNVWAARTRHGAMYEDRNALGVPFFKQRLSQDWEDTERDEALWAAMGRNEAHSQGVWGTVAGAAFAGAGTLAAQKWRERHPPAPIQVPPRVPHPFIPGMGIHGNVAAPAA